MAKQCDDSKADDKSEGINDIPDAFLCPISHQIMRDPYVDSDGNSYDKMHITEWLREHPISPITRNSLSLNNLVPNRVLKTLIDTFISNNNIQYDERSESKLGQESLQDKQQKQNDSDDLLRATLGRKPLMLFTLIDTSGSMGIGCGSNASGENDGYSRLDLVKHTLNTIIHSLTSVDQICIITFSTIAELFAQNTMLTDSNKVLLQERVKQLEAGGQTNIWDSMRLALDHVSLFTNNSYNVEIYLLTDGEPNINPPGDLVVTIQDYMYKKCTNKLPIINTFGYGYNLDSTMLYNMARVGNGIFGFIPDSTMVGTVFINALSNSMVGEDYEQRSNPIANSILLRFVSLLETLREGGTPLNASNSSINKQGLLREFVNYLESLPLNDGDTEEVNQHNRLLVAGLIEDCSESDNKNSGQIAKAVEPAFMAQWGLHYLSSVQSAFEKRMCINFKDHAMQVFKSTRFITEQRRVEEVFTILPPPKPSDSSRGHSGSPRSYGGSVQTMAGYYDASGGCFAGESKVRGVKIGVDSAGKGWRVLGAVEVKDLRKGSVVQSCVACEAVEGESEGGSGWRLEDSQVECVVKMRYTGALHQVTDDLTLTPYHPVLPIHPTRTPTSTSSPSASASSASIMIAEENSDVFPCELTHNSPQIPHFDGYVYDVVLSNRGLLLAQGGGGCEGNNVVWAAATFGHNVNVGRFRHAYFGSEKVVNDLKRQQSGDAWEAGWLEMERCEYRRGVDGTVQGMIPSQQDKLQQQQQQQQIEE